MTNTSADKKHEISTKHITLQNPNIDILLLIWSARLGRVEKGFYRVYGNFFTPNTFFSTCPSVILWILEWDIVLGEKLFLQEEIHKGFFPPRLHRKPNHLHGKWGNGKKRKQRGRQRLKGRNLWNAENNYEAIEHGQYLGANLIGAVVHLGGGNGTNDNNHSFYLHEHDGLRWCGEQ